MRKLLTRLWRDETGVIISAELVLILTIVVIGVIVGLVQVQHAVVAELNDVGLALSHLNQSYAFTGFRGAPKWWGPTSWTAGSSFIDLYEGPAVGVVDVGGFAAGFGSGYGAGFGGFGFGYGFGARGAIYGTIVLADGTMIPITWIASGTWSLPGGIILRATTANSNRLVLADGTIIGFLLGLPAIVELADGAKICVRPGAAGTWVMADGRIITLDATKENTGILADGTTVVIRIANPAMVVLANGIQIEARAGAAGTLVLPDGRVIRLQDAILPPGSEEIMLDLPGGGAAATVRGDAVAGTLVFADGTLVPLTWKGEGQWTLPGDVELTAKSPDANQLVLADGKTIGFLFGLPAIVELADKTVMAARPGAPGTWVLADGRIVTQVRDQENAGRLADGTLVGLRLIDSKLVLLANGTTVEVESATAAIITLKNGLVITLATAILPRLPAPVTPHFGQGVFIEPLYPVIPPFRDLNVIPRVVPDFGPLPGVLVAPPVDALQPGCCEGPHTRWPRKRRLTEEIPQGPASQYLPQL